MLVSVSACVLVSVCECVSECVGREDEDAQSNSVNVLEKMMKSRASATEHCTPSVGT